MFAKWISENEGAFTDARRRAGCCGYAIPFNPRDKPASGYIIPRFIDRTTEAHRGQYLAKGDISTQGQSRDVNAAPRESSSSACPHTIKETEVVAFFSPVSIPIDTQ